MTVEDADKIDIIARSKDGKRHALVITDHLEWGLDLTGAHLATLQAKINLYYAYLQSEAFASSHPDAAELDLAIEVVFMHQPDETAVEFLEMVALELPKDGYDFVYRFAEGYA